MIWKEKLILFGENLRFLQIYDVATQQYTDIQLSYERKDKLDEKNPKRVGSALSVWNSKVIISGGYDTKDSSKYSDHIYLIDLDTKKLEKIGRLPEARSEHKSVISPDGSKMIITGGFVNQGEYSDSLLCTELFE